MRRALVVLACLLLCFRPAPGSAQAIFSIGGRDEFQWIEYVGGDATQRRERMGWLVLTDSTLSLHACGRQFCATHKDLPLYDSIPYFTIPLRSITDVSSSTQVRGPSTGSKIAFGLLAGDRKEEFVGLVYETATSAEAPIFKTQKAQASALEAKIRFRLKKLGIVLPAPTP